MDGDCSKYGARAYLMGDGVVLVKQTVLRGRTYVIDAHKERHVDPGHVQELGQAVLDACNGHLSAGKG